MSSITTINSTDLISGSRTDINTNFSNLNTDKIETSVIDTDTSLAANSDLKVATQKAVKAYVDTGGNVNASTTAKGIVEEATLAEVIAGTAAGATGARLFVNPSTISQSRFPGTQVFSGGAPTTNTDLDLSAVVGVAQKIVLLKVSSSGAGGLYGFRKNGETILVADNSGNGAGGVNLNTNNRFGYVIVITDTAGVIEWISSTANATTVVTVESYW